MAEIEKRENLSLNDKSVAGVVLSRIRGGGAKMKPRWHFVLKTILSVLGILILVFSLLYLVSFVIFILKQTGLLFLPSFGFRGFGLLLVSLPKLILLAIVVFIILLELLVKHYAFAYRKPIIYSVTGVLVMVFFGGLIFHWIGLHNRLFMFAENMHVPVMRPFYRGYISDGPREVYPGIITAINESTILMNDRFGSEFEVIITSETRLPFGFDFSEGDEVVVFGESSTGTIKAYGVRRVDFQHPGPRRGGYREPTMFFKAI